MTKQRHSKTEPRNGFKILHKKGAKWIAIGASFTAMAFLVENNVNSNYTGEQKAVASVEESTNQFTKITSIDKIDNNKEYKIILASTNEAIFDDKGGKEGYIQYRVPWNNPKSQYKWKIERDNTSENIFYLKDTTTNYIKSIGKEITKNNKTLNYVQSYLPGNPVDKKGSFELIYSSEKDGFLIVKTNDNLREFLGIDNDRYLIYTTEHNAAIFKIGEVFKEGNKDNLQKLYKYCKENLRTGLGLDDKTYTDYTKQYLAAHTVLKNNGYTQEEVDATVENLFTKLNNIKLDQTKIDLLIEYYTNTENLNKYSQSRKDEINRNISLIKNNRQKTDINTVIKIQRAYSQVQLEDKENAKDQLKAIITKAKEKLKSPDLSEKEKAKLSDTIRDMEKSLNNKNLTTENIEELTGNLNESIVNKEKLKTLLDTIDLLNGFGLKKEFSTIFDKALSVYNNKNSTQDSVDENFKQLNQLVTDQKNIFDKDAIKEFIESYSDLKLSSKEDSDKIKIKIGLINELNKNIDLKNLNTIQNLYIEIKAIDLKDAKNQLDKEIKRAKEISNRLSGNQKQNLDNEILNLTTLMGHDFISARNVRDYTSKLANKLNKIEANQNNSSSNQNSNSYKPVEKPAVPDSSVEKLNTVASINYIPGYGVVLRDQNGKIVSPARYLAHGTNWKINAKKVINGVTYYRLGNDNQWIEGKYLSFGAKENPITKLNTVGKVVYNGRGGVLLLTKDGKIPAKRQYLKNNTSWKVNAMTVANGRTLYRLGTDNQWIPAEYLNL